VGNLAENDRMFLLLLDYAQGTRLKIWGRGEAVDDDPALFDRVRDPDYPAKVERVIRMRVEAWDTNCNSHIPRLLPGTDIDG
jgi:predicted pyridoxine 5'-phosphate oxidase superfamily flavin-nucleotide-binding protein